MVAPIVLCVGALEGKDMEAPNLSWIDNQLLVEIATKRFEKSVKKARNDSLETVTVEPTLAIVRAGLTGSSMDADAELNVAVSLTKTLQNAVGLFHQDVLGSVQGWRSSGPAGGVVDLHGHSPVTGEDIVAEVKMRYNTIKSSDEPSVWDKLKNASRTDSREGACAYLFQIVPKTAKAYNRPWVVSNRPRDARVRAVDGVTAYHLVTGDDGALRDLLFAMPWVMRQVLIGVLGTDAPALPAYRDIDDILAGVLSRSLPASPAHAYE